ncbi:hypothetical protein SRABI44_00546 [Microbacterium foliorum]|nr:hypothetical protein SRABI44_00546 [Microbacterium foliorum]CAH0145674.1 hypothetical protein SRABI03_00629 [Microbacterium foliorum]
MLPEVGAAEMSVQRRGRTIMMPQASDIAHPPVDYPEMSGATAMIGRCS